MISTDVDRAVRVLRRGGLVAIPTETVYGLAADADDPLAVRRIFSVKARPLDHPLIVHVHRPAELDRWAVDISPDATTLATTCWPGPLTVVVHRAPRVIDGVTGGRDSVAVRVPAHPMTLELIERFGGGLAAPSANRFGAVSPTTAEHVLADIGTLLDPARDMILDGGATKVGLESTIVDCTVDPPQVLRPGGIPDEHIAAIIGRSLAPTTGPSRASGMLESHYAPRCRVRTVARRADADAIASTARAGAVEVLDLTDDLVAYAHELYARLRDADARHVEVVVAVLPPPSGLGHAIRDRLLKAAAAR
jgi:L-threonylcarbamoyladenylate synthase